MSRPTVWLAGPPGSGKTSAGRRAAAALDLGYASAGERFRLEAEGRGMSLPEFSRFAEAHPEVDRELDRALVESARPGTVLEGRVVGALLRRTGAPVFAVWIDAREEVRAHRLAGRDGTDVPTALARMRERSASEFRRYRAFYGIDPATEPYEGRLDTSDLDVAESAARLARLLEGSGVRG